MAEKGRRAGLSSADKEALLSTVYSSGGRKSRSTVARPTVAVDQAKLDFKSLPGYQEIKTQRAVADMIGLKNPFYRPHEGRAGPTTIINNKTCVNFASYDYLGLNGHPDVANGAKAAIDKYGTSVSASRITAGERPIHRELEAALAALHGVDDAVAFVSGHATNVNVIGDLLGPKDLILHDALVHNSVTVGSKLSGAARRNFPHNDIDALERILSETRSSFERVLIIVEGLYSMDGDFPDLPRLIEVKKRYGAWLMVDEAHSLGVLGDTGRGIGEYFGINSRDVDIWMGTLSKTLSSCGGYIAGPTALIEFLKFTSDGFVYSVGMSPALAGAALAALKIMEREPERVALLRQNGELFTKTAKSMGLDTGLGVGYSVVPVIIGDSLKTVKLTERLLERGFNVIPIIYPAVPMKSGRLRFFLTSEHTKDHICSAIKATREELDRIMDENFGIEAVADLLTAEE